MTIYVYGIGESYKYTIISHMGNLGTVDLLLHMVQCWRACAFNEENWDINIVLYC